MKTQRPRKRRVWARRLGWAALTLAVLLVGSGVWVYSRLSYTPPPPPPPSVPPQQAERAVQQVQQQVEAIRRYSQARIQTPYRLHIRSEDLNGYLNSHLPAPGSLPHGIEGIRDVRVAFDGGRIIVTGFITAWGRQMHATVAGRVIPDSTGSISFVPDEMLVGRMPMPARMREEAARRIQEELRRAVAETGVSVTSVETANGNLIIQGLTAGRNSP